jgi:uncharacterized protein YycO
MKTSEAVAPGTRERMGASGWRQTATDLPAVIVASGLGYGISKTIADEVVRRRVARGLPALSPTTKKYLPLGLAIGNAVMGYGLAQVRNELQHRRYLRAEMEKEPLPQSIPGRLKSSAAGGLAKHVAPGDIVVVGPGKPVKSVGTVGRALNTAFQHVSKAVQGDITHGGVYVGDGRVVEIRLDTGARSLPLAAFVRGRRAAVVRPLVSARTVERAVERAKHYTKARPDYDTAGLFRALAAHYVKMKPSTKVEEDKLTCSTLVSAAYKGVSFTKDKPHNAIMPVDILNSKKTQVVATKLSGVEPAPQSRGIPKKKPSDPWNYDPRPTFEL